MGDARKGPTDRLHYYESSFLANIHANLFQDFWNKDIVHLISASFLSLLDMQFPMITLCFFLNFVILIGFIKEGFKKQLKHFNVIRREPGTMKI